MNLTAILLSVVNTTWPQFHGEPSHSGWQQLAGAITQATIYELWSTPVSGATSRNSCAIADVNQDGVMDVIAPINGGQTLYSLRGTDGLVQWTASIPGTINNTHPATGDLVPLNGSLEIVLHDLSGWVHCFRGTDGSLLWSVSTGSGGMYVGPVCVADVVPGNGTLEVLAGNGAGQVVCLRGDNGATIWTSAKSGGIQGGPTVGELDSTNGTLEVVFGSDNAFIYCVRGDNGADIWSYNAGGQVRSTPSIAELVPGNGTQEVVVGNASTGSTCLRGDNGAFIWNYPHPYTYNASTAVGDLDGDGDNDVTINSYSGAAFRGYNGATGAQLWLTSFSLGAGASSPAICDIDGDGQVEVMTCSDNDTLYCVDGSTGAVEWTYPYMPASSILDPTIAVGDVDGDSCSEVVVMASDGARVYVLDGTGSGCGPVGVGQNESSSSSSGLALWLAGSALLRGSSPSGGLLSVYNGAGRQVLSERLGGGEFTLKLPSLPGGVYIARLKAVEGVATHRFVKVR